MKLTKQDISLIMRALLDASGTWSDVSMSKAPNSIREEARKASEAAERLATRIQSLTGDAYIIEREPDAPIGR